MISRVSSNLTTWTYTKSLPTPSKNHIDLTTLEVELGKNKLESGYETFREFYENDWNRFIDYNIIDTKLVDELDDKMKFLELIITMAYDCKCNYNDIFSSVRTWDCLLYNHLSNRTL